ncbi:cation transporter, permease component [Mycobacteroides abscessus 5S-0422]|uniref:Cation diffusion facilitator transporter family protein n=1 Tax=Mycobacteroides abscessus subsp. bolletii 1513 TaxID=1299321 RepID=X8DHT6_9MYCO|nr:cation diffusion facilitator family transporter [Mycobacteroides abscessus]EUA68202.1 cation diffusion facilitator transporter family protein [Mycobacteroides abscessus subsp. bolletii 1513]AMU76599.1 cation diffusion facilitator family transporter [Mycobacteroides abscessus]ANO25544.1 cation diffusion facilitator family transporter [Mycobacteroides abscessus]EIU04920.1 cation transporter, permease component [Mycobacteroides abscessus 5S-0422]EIU07887.1 cation transporter, permease componen
MSAGGSKRAIIAALAANAGIAVAKFIGFAITGSSSMLAESVHSIADTSNQGLLLYGQRAASKEADRLHPFGYGRSRFFYSFVVALVLFTLGSVFALYEGYHKIHAPEHLQSPIVAIVILGVAIALEGYSFRTAFVESKPLKGGASWWQFIRNSRNPELPVVLLEDTGALLGLAFALFGVGMTIVTGDPVWDGIGTVAIGVLLGVIAIVLMVEMKSLLIGEGATATQEKAILDALAGTDDVERVIHCRTQYLGPEELLVAAKIAITPSAELPRVAATIDAAERRVRAAVPIAQVIYLEPDLDRSAANS